MGDIYGNSKTRLQDMDIRHRAIMCIGQPEFRAHMFDFFKHSTSQYCNEAIIIAPQSSPLISERPPPGNVSVYNEYDDDVIEILLNQQFDADDKPNRVIYMDGIDYPMACKSPIFKHLVMYTRRLNITLIMMMRMPYAMSPCVRANVDYVISRECCITHAQQTKLDKYYSETGITYL